MKRLTKNITALLLLVALLISSCITVVSAGQQPSSYSTYSNSGERDVVCTTLNGTSASSYYTGNYTYDKLEDLSQSNLKSSLKNLMKSTHKTISSYDDCHYKANRTDCENENGNVSLIYTSYSATMNQWNGWNREHVWPKSLGGDNTSGGGADLHHIRPSDATVNSTRGNKKYGNLNGGSATYGSNPATGVLGGYSGTYFEPLDNVKGDVARICLYVYVRWGSEWGADSITKVFQSVDVLLEWCELDPVDTWEMGRNEVVQSIQGNRNVFIDYPELAWVLFGEEIPSDMVTPSGKAASGTGSGSGSGTTHTHSYTSAITKQPTCTVAGEKTFTCSTCGDTYTQPVSAVGHKYQDGECTVCGASDGSTTVCKHSNTELRGAVSPGCQSGGYTGDLYCLDCGELVSQGSTVPSLIGHDFGEWQTDAEGRVYKFCSVCGKIQDINVDALLAETESDAELILLLISLGVADKMLVDELS